MYLVANSMRKYKKCIIRNIGECTQPFYGEEESGRLT